MSVFDSTSDSSSKLSLLVADADQLLHQTWLPEASGIEFQIDDIPFSSSYIPDQEEGVRVFVWATLGYFPYSVESHQKRELITKIIFASRRLVTARFGVSQEQKIMVSGEFVAPDFNPPAFIFPQIITLWQEARPFVQLIGECL